MQARRYFLALLFAAAASCAPRTFNTADVQHVDGQLVTGRHPTYWAQVSPAEHEKLIKAIQNQQDPKSTVNVTWEHPIIQRLQIWVDAIDSAARKTIWGQKYMVATPKPRVLLTDDESPNAFVAPAFVKYSADITVPGNNGKTAEVGTIMTTSTGPNTMAVMVEAFMPTVFGRYEFLGDVVDRQRFVINKLGGSCLPQNVGQGRISYVDCKIPENTSAKHGVTYLSKQTAPYITVHIGLLRMMDEESVIATLAHELGHYYRAHATDDNMLGSGFFYYEKDSATAKQPVAIVDASIEKQGRAALEAAVNRIPNGIPGTIIENEVLMGLLRSTVHEKFSAFSDLKSAEFQGVADQYGFVPFHAVLLRKCRAVHANKIDCDAFEKALANPAVASVLSEEKSPEKSAYDALERALLAATSDLKIGRYENKISISSADISMRDAFFSSHNNVSEGVLSACGRAYGNETYRTKQTVFPLRQLLFMCSSEINQSRRAADAMVGSLVLRGIGWYTTEQEADEIAAEAISSVGIDAQKASSHLWALFKYIYEKKAKVTGVDYLTCQNLARNNFGIGTGNVRTVALGDWADNHHDLCYRIYNMTRDLLVHNYKTDVSKRPQFSMSWDNALRLLPAPRGDASPHSVNNGFFLE